jgi:hypothetical protein
MHSNKERFSAMLHNIRQYMSYEIVGCWGSFAYGFHKVDRL